jgi:hypothetical protein
MRWVYNPHAGGVKISPKLHARIRAGIEAYAAKNYAGKYDRLNVRFHGALCYVDSYRDGGSEPVHLVQLPYFASRSSVSRGATSTASIQIARPRSRVVHDASLRDRSTVRSRRKTSAVHITQARSLLAVCS